MDQNRSELRVLSVGTPESPKHAGFFSAKPGNLITKIENCDLKKHNEHDQNVGQRIVYFSPFVSDDDPS